MAKVYLDTNYFIDLIEQRRKVSFDQFRSHLLCLSPLSIHVYIYLYKLKVPNKKLEKISRYFTFIPLDEKITTNSLKGPTEDFEDNLQLHSAAAEECDFFLTNDDRLFSRHFFGKTQITKSLS